MSYIVEEKGKGLKPADEAMARSRTAQAKAVPQENKRILTWVLCAEILEGGMSVMNLAESACDLAKRGTH